MKLISVYSGLSPFSEWTNCTTNDENLPRPGDLVKILHNNMVYHSFVSARILPLFKHEDLPEARLYLHWEKNLGYASCREISLKTNAGQPEKKPATLEDNVLFEVLPISSKPEPAQVI